MLALAPPPQQKAPAATRGVAARVPQLPALTGLRFVAALFVVCHHFTTLWRVNLFPRGTAHSATAAVATTVGDIWRDGWLGVNLFFVLSGFILAYTYIGATGTWRGTRRAFYIARVARIYPSYLLALLLNLIPLLWHEYVIPRPSVTMPATLLLVNSWLSAPDVSWSGPGWSLQPEAFFYLLFPLLILPIARLARRHLVLLCGLCWVATLVMTSMYHGQGNPWVFETRPFVRLPEFLLGLAAGRLFTIQQAREATPRFNVLMVPIAAIASLAVLATGIAVWPDLWLHIGLCDPVFVLLIYALAYGRGAMARVLSWSPLVLLGEASYALYLLHWSTWSILMRVLGQPLRSTTSQVLPSVALFALYLPLVVALSVVSYRYFECPMRRAIRRRFS